VIRNASTLSRWMQFSPGTRMPDDIKELDMSAQFALQQADGELYALLSGVAPAELEIAALNNALAASAPTAEQKQDAATAARIAELTATNPFGQAGYYNEQGELVPPVAGNMTAAMELKSLNPALAAQLEAAAQPAAAQQGHQWTQGDLQVLARHGYTVPQS
jgi:hypothetical protein